MGRDGREWKCMEGQADAVAVLLHVHLIATASWRTQRPRVAEIAEL